MGGIRFGELEGMATAFIDVGVRALPQGRVQADDLGSRRSYHNSVSTADLAFPRSSAGCEPRFRGDTTSFTRDARSRL